MKFKGDQKKGKNFLCYSETWLKNKLVPFVPKSIETYHLTLTTVLWSVLVVVFSFLAINNINWLWGVCLMIFFQYITDLLDGEIGRQRKTGLIKWGYYMDHFLDYIFLCAMLASFFIILPTEYKLYQFFILAIFGAFMVNSFLSFSTTNEFQISYLGIGPTEIRIVFIFVFIMHILIGKTFMAQGLPYLLILATLGLIVQVYSTQKAIWKIDMKEKSKTKKK